MTMSQARMNIQTGTGAFSENCSIQRLIIHIPRGTETANTTVPKTIYFRAIIQIRSLVDAPMTFRIATSLRMV